MKTLNNTAETQTGLEAPKALTRVARESLAAEIVNVPRETKRIYAESDIDVDHFIDEEDPNDVKIKQLNEEIRHLNAIKKKAEQEQRAQKNAEQQTRESIGTLFEGVATSTVAAFTTTSATGALRLKLGAAAFGKFVAPFSWAIGSGILGYFFGRVLRAYRNYTGSENINFYTKAFVYATASAAALAYTAFALIDMSVTFGTASAAFAAFGPVLESLLFMAGFAFGDRNSTGGMSTKIGNRIADEVIKKGSQGFHWRFIDIARKDGYSY